MKIRNRHLIRGAGKTVARAARLWFGSLRWDEEIEDQAFDPFLPGAGQSRSALWCAWHENLALLMWRLGVVSPTVIISQSDDGELITSAAESLGWTVIRGSSTRGGAGALKSVLKLVRGGKPATIAFTADGPRGPRRQLKPGVLFAASATGIPILPGAIAADGPWRAKSWDRLLLPKPLSRVQMVTGKAIHIPPGLDEAGIEVQTRRVEAELDRIEAKAEDLLRRRKFGDGEAPQQVLRAAA